VVSVGKLENEWAAWLGFRAP